MRDAVEIVGPVTAAAKDLFLRVEVSIESFDPEHKLWDCVTATSRRAG